MVQFPTPTGRLVWGHPLRMTNKLGDDGKPVIDPQTNQPVKVTSFGVAFDKATFQTHMVPKIMEAVQAVYPQGAPGHFAWKFVDGDAATGQSKGKPYNQREGYPGHYVMKFETMFPIVAYRQNGASWDQITDTMMKTGDYIAVGVNMEAHREKQNQRNSTPGLYTNPNGVLHIGDGPAIINAPDAQSMFGGQQFALPPGAVAPGTMQPQGNVNPPGMAMPQPGMPGMPGQAQPQYQPQPGMPGMPGQAQPQYQPDPSFVQNAMGQAAPQPGMPGPMQQR